MGRTAHSQKKGQDRKGQTFPENVCIKGQIGEFSSTYRAPLRNKGVMIYGDDLAWKPGGTGTDK